MDLRDDILESAAETLFGLGHPDEPFTISKAILICEAQVLDDDGDLLPHIYAKVTEATNDWDIYGFFAYVTNQLEVHLNADG